jgi:hypothetical protein
MKTNQRIKKALKQERRKQIRHYLYKEQIVENETIADLKNTLNFKKQTKISYKTLSILINTNQIINFKTWIFDYGIPELQVYIRKFDFKDIYKYRFFMTCENYCSSIGLKLNSK